MMRRILLPLTALTVCVFALAAPAASDESPGPMGMERMQHWAADHEALLDAKLAGLKAGLKLLISVLVANLSCYIPRPSLIFC